MSETSNNKANFIERTEAVIIENLSNEQFGVSELADVMHMSRSNLLRKIKKQTQLSASQFIRQVRLRKSKELLQQTSLSISEIAYQVGFGSTSYYIKCFREEYGYPPGKTGEQESEKETINTTFIEKYRWQIIGIGALAFMTIAYLFLNKPQDTPKQDIERSIAVLPFKNESMDTSNLYFVNGLMESTLGNLQKIEDLRVISRTSVERYRNTKKGIPEIAKDLNVNYLVEGSGQRVGNHVLLSIQLIEVSSDRPIWAEQYNREIDDIFSIQHEVARNIAERIEAIVTPAELEQIDKKPTENLVAYEYYLKALEPYNTRTQDGLEEAIMLFEKAIGHDSQFALAYAKIAISYYFLDLNRTEKQHTEQLNNNADKALLYDSRSAESLIAKALYYMHIKEFRLALPHLEKALEYNPNSSVLTQILASLYSHNIPNTAKYLEYALKGIQLDINANDSISNSFIHLHVGNALIQTGFVDESLQYIDQSINYYPENIHSPYLKILILYVRDRDIEQTTALLTKEWRKDTTRLDILQHIGHFHYYQENYDSSFFYFKKFVKIKENAKLDIYPHLDMQIGLVYEKMGMDERASDFLNAYADYCENDQSIYKSLSLATMHIHDEEYDQAIEQLKLFATQKNYQYWILVFLDIDPLLKQLKPHPEYEAVIQKIHDRFWEDQKDLKQTLEAKRLI